jgi:hypothetical protein
MSTDGDDGVTLTVRAAEKRDAGRGVARLSEAARRELGILSGDTVVIEGTHVTAAKFWPADADQDEGTIRIDADTRTNAGAKVGDLVTVTAREINDAQSVTLAPPSAMGSVPSGVVERAVRRDLDGRPVSVGEHVRLERISQSPFHVVETVPDGPVRVEGHTKVSVRNEAFDAERDPTPGANDPDGGTERHQTISYACSDISSSANTNTRPLAVSGSASTSTAYASARTVTPGNSSSSAPFSSITRPTPVSSRMDSRVFRSFTYIRTPSVSVGSVTSTCVSFPGGARTDPSAFSGGP